MPFQKNVPSIVTRKGGKEANKTNECKHTGRKCPKKVSCLFNTWLEHDFWLFLLSFSFRAKSGLTGIELGLKVCQYFEIKSLNSCVYCTGQSVAINYEN